MSTPRANYDASATIHRTTRVLVDEKKARVLPGQNSYLNVNQRYTVNHQEGDLRHEEDQQEDINPNPPAGESATGTLVTLPAANVIEDLRVHTLNFNVGRTAIEQQNANEIPQTALKQSFDALNAQLAEDANKKHFWSHNARATAERIASLTKDLQIKLHESQGTRDALQFQKYRGDAILHYERECKKTSGWEKFGKAIAAICFAVVGLIAGVTVGAAIGYGVSAWTGPGGFVGAAAGAFMGGAVGLAMGLTFALGLTGGLAAGLTSGHLLFKPTLARQKAQQVVENARQQVGLGK
jgi:hypothetical protein